MNRTAEDWPDHVHRVLADAGARQIAYVPDSGMSRLIELCQDDPAMTTVVLTSEQEGVALLAGAWLGGQRGALLMQGSGIGNCVNLLSLTQVCRFPLLIIATMRGESGETNPWQVPMGSIAGDVLSLAAVRVYRAETASTVGETVAEAAREAFEGPAATAVLIAQAVIGIKSFDDD
ncbi:MAG: phosphonopyruvate decarboxylase [Proteobacteria bacterium]|nr:phosphonopyruvate decarboxylase [Pseudomonadota bacterium]